MKKQTYGNNSISSLKGADRVRLRPAVIFGSDDAKGSRHTLFEILSNSVDEAKSGYGSVILITKHRDFSWTIQDYGRGIPLDWNDNEQRYNWELVLCEMYAGGKYNLGEDENYENSLGTNGLGLTSSQYASEFMKVISVRDGYGYEIEFAHGEPVTELKKEKLTMQIPTGTTITYKPDSQVFTDININFDEVAQICKEQAVVAKGIKFILKDEASETTHEFYYEKGIADYIIELGADKAISDVITISGRGTGQDADDRKPYKANFDMVLCFTNHEPKQLYFHNSSNLEQGGSTQIATRNALTYVVDKYLKDNGKYNKGEKSILAVDVLDSLLSICSSFSTVTSYTNQTKLAINNKFIQELVTENIKETFTNYLIENPIEAEKITQQILVNSRARTKAESTRLNVKKKLGEKITVTNKPKKYVDCRSKDKTKREIYVVEGDSALGACKLGRDAEYQAIMPLRGKILNCLKADYEKIFGSDVIVDLIKVFGCGVEVESKHAKDVSQFNIENLNFSKICICTDGDVDGWQIRVLVIIMIYRLMPQLLEQGYVYIADTPLFEITAGRGKKEVTRFAYSEQEKQDILMELAETVGGTPKIQRSKGLGENTPEMMWETTMNPETRRLIQVTMEDAEMYSELFDMFVGDNLEGRKEYIAENIHAYM